MMDSIEQFWFWVKSVCKGWWFYLTDNEATRQMSRDRLRICDGLENTDPNTQGQYEPCFYNRNGVCASCGCPLKAKTRVITEHCPEKRW